MKIRPASSFLDLDTAMNMVKEINTLTELKNEITAATDGWFNAETVTCKDYGYDNRTGWNTYLICCDFTNGEYKQQAVFFADSPISDLKE